MIKLCLKIKAMKKNKQTGFTLIELLVVISIIGILAALLLTNFLGIRQRGKDTKKKEDLRQLGTALRMYYNDYQGYPAESGDYIDGAAPAGSFTVAGVTYMQEVPEYTKYEVDGTGEVYAVKVLLKNTEDPEAAKSQTRCANAISQANLSVSDGEFVVCSN